MENVHSVGNVSEGHEGADDDDEAGRDRRDLRQVQGEGGAYPTNKTEQTRRRQKELYVSMEVDHVSGSEPQEEDLEEVDEVRRVSLCYNFGMMGHFAGACRKKGKGKGERRRQGIQQRKKGKRQKAGEREVQANGRGPMGGYFQKNSRVGDTKDGAGRAARSDTGHEKADVASLASTKKRQAAEKAGDNQIQKKQEKSEECRSSGMWRRSRRKRGARVSQTPWGGGRHRPPWVPIQVLGTRRSTW